MMAQPTADQAQGYDVVLWIDKDGDVIASPYTEQGEKFIRKINPSWKPGVHMVVQTTPKRFFKVVPDSVTVGMMRPDGLETVITNTLQ